MRIPFLIGFLIVSFSLTAQVLNVESANGLNIFYYPNGQISSKGNMLEGKPDGLWVSYYVNGVIKSEGIWRNAQLDSVWQFYNDKGQLVEKINYYNGKKNGYYYVFVPFDSLPAITYLASQELYYDNKKNGFSEYFYSNGTLHLLVPFKDNLRHGTAREFNQQGLLITLIEYRSGKEIDREEINRYLDSLPNGVWKEFYVNGKLKWEKNFTNGILNGSVKEYSINGELEKSYRYENGIVKDSALDIASEIKIVEEFFEAKDSLGNLIKKADGGYIDGKPVGTHRTYDSLGRVVSSSLYDNMGKLTAVGVLDIEGNRVGDCIYYYDGGSEVLRAKSNFVNDKRHGPWEFYYFEGETEQNGIFVNGRIHGKWVWYFETGRVKREEYFKNGKEDGTIIEYDEYGKTILTGSYTDGLKQGEWFIDYGLQTEKGNYVNDEKQGVWQYFYQNGKLYFEGKFNQGFADGEHVFYYKNGKIKEKQFYSMGIKQRTWEYYDYYGSLIKTRTWQNDILIKIDGINIITEQP